MPSRGGVQAQTQHMIDVVVVTARDSVPPQTTTTHALARENRENAGTGFNTIKRVMSENNVDVVRDPTIISLILNELNIYSPSRERIVGMQRTACDIIGWMLYASSQQNIKNSRGFLINRLLNEEQYGIPEPFAQFARLEPAQWTAFALAARRRAAGLPPQLDPALQFLFETWVSVYGRVDFHQLPFGLGEAAAKLWEIECGEKRNGSDHASLETGRSQIGKWGADYG